MEFVGVPDLVEYYLNSIGLSGMITCSISLDIYTGVFKDRSSSKLNSLSNWNCTCFILGFSPMPLVRFCVSISSVIASTPLIALMSIRKSMFPIYFYYLSLAFSPWTIIRVVDPYYSSSVYIPTESLSRCFKRDSTIYLFILPPL